MRIVANQSYRNGRDMGVVHAGFPYSVYSKLFIFQDPYGQSPSLVETSSNAEEVG